MSWRLTRHKPYTDSKVLESDVIAQAYLAPASNSMLRRVEFRRRAAWKVPPSLIPRQLAASPNACLSARGRTRVRRGGSTLASHLSTQTWLARHVPQPVLALASRPAILRHRVASLCVGMA